MELLLILLIFLLPLMALCMSVYCLFHVLTLKKAAAKLKALSRISSSQASRRFTSAEETTSTTIRQGKPPPV